MLGSTFTGTTSINGAPPTMLSPTTMATFPVPQTNGQTEIYPNGLAQYPGKHINAILNSCAFTILDQDSQIHLESLFSGE